MEQTLNEKLGIIQTELKSKKSRYNSFGKYYFRSAEDILEAIKPFLIPMNLSVRITEEFLENLNIGYDDKEKKYVIKSTQ